MAFRSSQAEASSSTAPSSSQDALDEYLRHVRTAPYFRALYANADPSLPLSALPVSDPIRMAALSRRGIKYLQITEGFEGFYTHNRHGEKNERHSSGYTTPELRRQLERLATGLDSAGVRPDDVVALTPDIQRLFSPFPVATLAVQDLQATVIPLTSDDAEYMWHAAVYGLSTVLLTSASDLDKLLFYAATERSCSLGLVERVIVRDGAPDPSLLTYFPHLRIAQFPLGDMRTGFFARAANSKSRAFVPFEDTRVEILDDAGDPAWKGRLVVTNMGRRLQPIIRFPVEMEGAWVVEQKGLFEVTAWNAPIENASLAAKVDMRSLRNDIVSLVGRWRVRGLQLILKRAEEGEDKLRVCVDAETATCQMIADQLARLLGRGKNKQWENQCELALVPIAHMLLDDVTGEVVDVVDQVDEM